MPNSSRPCPLCNSAVTFNAKYPWRRALSEHILHCREVEDPKVIHEDVLCPRCKDLYNAYWFDYEQPPKHSNIECDLALWKRVYAPLLENKTHVEIPLGNMALAKLLHLQLLPKEKFSSQFPHLIAVTDMAFLQGVKTAYGFTYDRNGRRVGRQPSIKTACAAIEHMSEEERQALRSEVELLL